ncbi:hypothetical protein C9I98_03565 [Photobacterium sanctipauli]|uniref:Lipoprotein n=1 Tax=Photobacterium sanctipauli TaxID=1342794 RepID=A0A2T3NXL7_9GAMM|nr:hypothetical protein [Photobacterium sanctipauli]PSW21043.1 hypothetical protein C9I98_03565 [Photobacterium sanctipauli]
MPLAPILLASIVAVTTIVGCAESRHEKLAELGFTRNYLDGYQDGCSSRKLAARTHQEGFRRDPERMETDNRYANGWSDGFEQCFASNQEYH